MSRYNSPAQPATVPTQANVFDILRRLEQLLVTFALGLIVLWTTTAEAGVNFVNAASMTFSRSYHTGIVLDSGNVLVAGGYLNGSLLNTSELYDPNTDTWSSANNLGIARWQHMGVKLLDGKVLISGGISTAAVLTTAELYDPVTGIWSSTGSMSTARVQHTMTLLNSGKVLVTGGGMPFDPVASAEIYDPTTGLWSSAGNMSQIRQHHTATLLNSGQVLVVGGEGGNAPSTAEIYDPTTNTWSNTGSLSVQHNTHGAALLANGKVLIVGGAGNAFFRSSELYDPATGTWATTGNLIAGRTYVSGLTLTMPDGQVLVVGGFYSPNALASAELYNPGTEAWSDAGTLTLARYAHSVNLLGNGKVLAAGGENGFGSNNSAELYTQAAPLADTIPTAFTFVDQTGVALSTQITSAPAQITGINAATSWTAATGTACVSSGNICTCDVAAHAASGTITNNQYLCAQHTSSASNSTATNTLVTVGGVSDTFTSTTLAAVVTDTTPNAFTFGDQSGVALSTQVTSAPLQITGINAATNWTVTTGTACVSSGNNCTCDVAGYAASATITNNQYLCVRQNSSANGSTATHTLVTVGGISDTFSTTTQAQAEPQAPNPITPTAIPTLSEWSTALLAGLLGLFGLGMMRRRASVGRY